jgi:hypothetical protein
MAGSGFLACADTWLLCYSGPGWKHCLPGFNQTVVDTIDDAHRFTGGSFSDYVTRYTGLSVVNMEDSTTSYYAEDEDDGLTMNLGSNPFLQYGVAATKERWQEPF